MDIRSKLIEWSKTRPVWQQDALRRLASCRSLADGDKREIIALLKRSHGSPPEGEGSLGLGLELADLPDASETTENVALHSICNVQHAAQLVPGETLSFATKGLTVVYGDNGSGKSGYTRILKRATRSRGQNKQRVLANVFDERFREAPPASACINLEVDLGAETKVLPFDWIEGRPTADQLSRVRVFDSAAAAVYVSEECEISFLPVELDILQALGELSSDLSRTLESERESIAATVTELARAIPDLGNARSVVDGLAGNATESDLERVSKWDEAVDGAVLKALDGQVDDVARHLEGLKATRARCEGLSRRLLAIESALTDDLHLQVATSYNDVQVQREAVARLSQEAFVGESLPGVGGGPWRVLWDAAKAYSTQEAYRNKEFPPFESDEFRCVLCHQVVAPDARERLRRFKDFVEGRIVSDYEAAAQRLSELRALLESVQITQIREDSSLVEEIRLVNADCGSKLSSFLEASARHTKELKRALASGDFGSVSRPPAPLSQELNAVIAAIKERIQVIETATAPEQGAEQESLRADLVTRKTLREHTQTLQRIVALRRELDLLEYCRNSLNPRAVTDQKKLLEKELLHRPFSHALEEELLGFNIRQSVTLGFRGERAVTYQRARFSESEFDGLSTVLSEGEYRAVALACFLSEVRQAPGNPPIVVDDPVSSFDHERRARVTKRLVREARQRQVVVFTHDVAFYADLIATAAIEPVDVRSLSLLRAPEGCGHVDEHNTPWHMRKVSQRLQTIEAEDLPRVVSLYQSSDGDYPRAARALAGRLRDTWERSVEEVLFNDAVNRFRRAVQTDRLSVVYVDDDLWREVNRGMTQTSVWEHDTPGITNDAPPSPTDFREEVQRLRAFRKRIKAEQKNVENRRR